MHRLPNIRSLVIVIVGSVTNSYMNLLLIIHGVRGVVWGIGHSYNDRGVTGHAMEKEHAMAIRNGALWYDLWLGAHPNTQR